MRLPLSEPCFTACPDRTYFEEALQKYFMISSPDFLPGAECAPTKAHAMKGNLLSTKKRRLDTQEREEAYQSHLTALDNLIVWAQKQHLQLLDVQVALESTISCPVFHVRCIKRIGASEKKVGEVHTMTVLGLLPSDPNMLHQQPGEPEGVA